MLDFVSESEILLTWLSEDSDCVNFVNSDGVWRTKRSEDKMRIKQHYQFNTPVMSAWIESTSGYLYAASSESISIVNIRDWRLKHEHKMTEPHEKATKSDEFWLCSVPGSWLQEYTNNVPINGSLIILLIEKKLKVIDIKTGKTWWRVLASHQTRGNFLSQFISLCLPNVHLTSLASAVSLVTRRLTCVFLPSEISDVQFSQDTVIVLTSDGGVWRLARDNLNLSQKSLISNGRGICVLGRVLSVLTRDGSVYKFDALEKGASIGIDKKEDGFYESSKILNTSKNINEHAASLNRLSESTSGLDIKLRQLQNYQYLNRCSKGDITKLLTFSAEADPEHRCVMCKFKVNTMKVSLDGKFWCLKIDMFNEMEENILTATTCFKRVLSFSHEPIRVNILAPNTEQIPQSVRCQLIFKTNLTSYYNSIKMLPPIALKPVILSPMDFLMIRVQNQNIGCSLRGSEADLFCKNLQNSFVKKIKLIFRIKQDVLDVEKNKIHGVIVESVKKEIFLSFLKTEVRIKSDFVKKGSELVVSMESTNGNILNTLKGAAL